MKKSVLFLIAAIYLLSIVAVGLYGIRVQAYDESIYPDYINLLNESNEAQGITIQFKEENPANPNEKEVYVIVDQTKNNQFQLQIDLTREDGQEVSDKRITYTLSNAFSDNKLKNNYLEMTEDGLITLGIKKGTSIITASSLMKAQLKLRIIFIIK